MATQIALLRAVNVAGHGKIAMADLRGLLAGLGFGNVRTLLQSGNAVFETDVAGEALERLLEAETEKQLGLRTAFMVRSAAEWGPIVAANPFPGPASDDPGHLVLMVMRERPSAAGVAALQAAIKGREMVRAAGRDVYITYPDGIGRSKVTNLLIERKLGSACTGRNWNTVLKLAAMAKG